MNLKKTLFATLFIFFLFIVSGYSQIEEPVKWKFSAEKEGENLYNLIIEASVDDHWHLYSQYFEMGGPMPLYIEFEESDKYRLIDSVVEYPEPKVEFDEIFNIEVKHFSGGAKFIQKIEVLTDNKFNINGFLDGQACYDDGKCIQISTDFIFPVNGGEAINEISTGKTVSATTPIIVTENIYENADKENRSLFGFFLISILFGLISILTPCVFPMIPMTISFFMQKSSSKFNTFFKAFVFGISIMLLYTLVGVIVSLTSAGADFTTVLSSNWIPNFIFFALFVVFAASLFGLFEIVLPTGLANKADKQVDKGGILSSFFLAVTLVIVSFSCTGPIIGALLVQAASGNVLEPTIGMLGFGFGFALPFTLLALFPSWLKKLPKSGGWLNSVKVVMGFIILAFSMKFLSNIDQNYHLGILSRDLYIAIWIVIAVLMGIYLLGKIKFSHDSDVNHVGFFRLLLAGSSFVFAIYLIPGLFGANLTSIAGLLPPKTSQKFDLTVLNYPNTDTDKENNSICETPSYTDILHMPYQVQGYFDWNQGLECAKSQDKPMLLYFTGHSCSNCKVMQAGIWSDKTVQDYLNNKVVVTALYVDEKTIEVPENDRFTSLNDGKLKKRLGEINADIQIVNFKNNTQPFYVLISPDGKVLTEPMIYNTDPQKFIGFLKNGIENFEKE
ncbi:MAG: thioredoxin family protein [Bacteroidales bacterium]|jgi:thiol:disulfide interchange protein DsbD|nr:thioredoxin family protein [Bacteroidales bacterium]